MTEPLHLPDWIFNHDDGPRRIILECAWFGAVGTLDYDLARDMARDVSTGYGCDASRFDRIVQLVVEAETFEHDPQAAIDSWNGTTRPGLSYAEAGPMALQLRADAVAEADTYARGGQHLRSVS